MIPASAELTAGILLKKPTVSWMPLESLPGRIDRSTNEAKFPGSVKSPIEKPGALVNFKINQ